MAINWKSNKLKSWWNGWWSRWVLLLILAIIMVSLYPLIAKNADQIEQSGIVSIKESLKDDFIENLLKASYVLPVELEGTIAGKRFFADTLYLPKFNGSGVYPINNLIENWQLDFNKNLEQYGLQYYIMRDKDKKSLTNSIENLEHVIGGQILKDKFQFYAVINFDAEGRMNVPFWWLFDKTKKEQLMTMDLNRTLIKPALNKLERFQADNVMKAFQPPKDYTLVFAAKDRDFYMKNTVIIQGQDGSFADAGFDLTLWSAIGCAFMLAFLLPGRKQWVIHHPWLAKIPFEVWVVIISIGTCSYLLLLPWSNFMMHNEILNVQQILHVIGIILLIFLILSMWHVGALCVTQLADLGIAGYLKKRTITGFLILKVKALMLCSWARFKSFLISLSEIDLRERSNKALIKLLLMLYGVLFIGCFIGSFLLLPSQYYSFSRIVANFIVYFGFIIPILFVVLFYILSKRLNQIKSNYNTLLSATEQMADKNLEIMIDQDLGMFNPLKEQLEKIKDGFKIAVAEEVKSQKLRSELITNVSHDLKTPVTAIITYVNLLLDQQGTEEDKQKYVNILNQKSQRLKRLIDDLLELSRTSDYNMVLNRMDVNIVEVIQQVEVELAERIKDSTIQFRFNLPDHKVLLQLDSERTYRIFENLYTNIIKYAAPHSRAYIEVDDKDQEVQVIFKNMSASELEFTAEDAMERFIRGDKARHTEGSGLGLAIVRNLVEMQGGNIQIVLDGDLFKVVITWPKHKNDNTITDDKI
ncbi:signal transduction histidine kinase [Paenibacillus turicensis]|uniref:histidine kinase n=1 Tax=Paenibacillus turicensis TaxID=160487 RepID=A0ABS4FR77_9BACL|nr:HAMP domain-containing sensor histidine kinase [Paenibacillus turicensis]MBP1905088.1 signal transduction histidine kinase [Paenibacillus turicensis]